MADPASGSRLIVGLGRETLWIEPGEEPLFFHRPVLPFSGFFVRPENPTGEVSTSGWKLPGLPGSVSGPVDFGASFTAAGLLEVAEHVLRGATALELEADEAYLYDFTQDPSAPETTFRVVYGLPPVDRAHLFGVKFSGVTQAMAPNAPIQLRLAGGAAHGTRIGTAVADVGNTGTWIGRPWLRGVMRDAAAGDIHVNITRVIGGIQFKVEVTTGVPTFPGAAVDVLYDADGRAIWQNLQDEAGLDVGIWGASNKDPVEIKFPGTAVEHADMDIGDAWVFPRPGTWADPVPTYIAGERFTSVHLFVDFRAQGAGVWNELRVDGGNANVVTTWPVSVGYGNSSKYPSAMDRDGDSSMTLQLPRRFRDTFFQAGLEEHDRFELRLRWLGGQIGSAGQWRESVVYEYPAVFISSAAVPASAATSIIETLNLVAEGGPAGEPPVVMQVITPRNWTPFADL